MRIPFAACPLCEATTLADHFVGDCSRHPLYQPSLPAHIQWKRCAACGHVFTDGYFTPEAATLVFGTINEHQTLGHDLERQRAVSARLIEKVLPFANGGGWLDIGFGNGSLLFTAQEYGFIPIGVDLRTPIVTALESLGIEAHCCDLTALSLDRPCAVLSMADVLEHMPFPKDGLRAAGRLLADDGVLFVSMPNSESMLWRALDQNRTNPYWGELEHYHNFGRSRLYGLLRETGFEPVKYGVSERYRACMEVIARKVGTES
jgi:protein O-GlcNAc transferase